MPLSFETGKYAPKVLNQPSFPTKHIAALVASICLSVGYSHSDRVRNIINSAVEVTVDNFPTTVAEAMDNFSHIRKW